MEDLLPTCRLPVYSSLFRERLVCPAVTLLYVMAKRIRAPDSSSGVSDQQSVGSSPCDTCVLKQESNNACKITQCTYRTEKGIAPVFLV